MHAGGYDKVGIVQLGQQAADLHALSQSEPNALLCLLSC